MIALRTRRRTRRALTATVALATVVGTGVAANQAEATPAHLPGHVYRSSLTPAQIAAYSKDADKRVIVLFRNQETSTLGVSTAKLGVRAARIARSQSGVRAELASLHAAHVHQFRFLNAVSAQISAPEAKRLAGNPDVLAVVPDGTVTLPSATSSDASPATTKSGTVTPKATKAVNTTKGLCGTKTSPLTEPEALGQIGASTAPYGATGKGVKIAVFPDGLDPDIKDFIHTNGTHAIFDYRDFSGDGLDAVTSGGEAFGDASSIVSQGRTVYDLSKIVNPALPLPANCDIRVRGVAPDASLAVMKVFGEGVATDSQLLQGMEWAVEHDHVNILSESFGSNPVTSAGLDPITEFNGLAVKAGITVVASSGDSGVANTIGAPAASTNGVISVGATTSFRSHAQLSEHGYQLGKYKGWESNNIATLSSGGFTDYGPNTVDLVAPGDSNWASCSTNVETYYDCENSYGGSEDAPGTYVFGGTSESCPLTAAAAALVIQAFRSTHKGVSPTPAQVKQFLTNTATDLGAPVEEQGAGQLNAARAVQLARSWGNAKTGNTLQYSPTKIATTGAPKSVHTAKITVRNQGVKTRKVTPTVTTFGTPTQVGGSTFDYNPTTLTTSFAYWLDGSAEPYAEQDFTVPKGYQRLNVRFGVKGDQTDTNQVVFEVLIDPSGKLAQDSDPQGGPAGFGQGDVRNPQAGTWRAIFFSRPGSDKYNGPITYQATVQKLVKAPLASISPASATLKSNALATFTVTYATPASAGDASMGVDFGSGVGELPILTRAVAQPTVAKPATFTGELTTGNGRQSVPSQELPFQFTVPAGVKNLDVHVNVAAYGYIVGGVLADPSGTVVDATSTVFADLSKDPATQTPAQDLDLTWANPKAGTWEIDLATVGGSSSGQVSTRINGTISFNTVSVTASGVPNSTGKTLVAGKTVTASVTVKNTGSSPKMYFIDPRRAGTSTYSLGFVNSPNGTLPVEEAALSPEAVVPPGTTSLTMVANSTKSASFTMAPAYGSPEIASTTGTTSVAHLSASSIGASTWTCSVGLTGPFAGETSGGTYACAAFATMPTIDDSVSATGGNVWDTYTDVNSPNVFTPADAVVVQPGQSTTLQVQITPSEADEDSTVSGYLDVQSFDGETFSGDDLVRIPYRYSVSAPASNS